MLKFGNKKRNLLYRKIKRVYSFGRANKSLHIHPGDFFFGDESGVITIPKELFTQVMNTTLAIKIKESNIIEALNAGKTLAQIIGLK